MNRFCDSDVDDVFAPFDVVRDGALGREESGCLLKILMEIEGANVRYEAACAMAQNMIRDYLNAAWRAMPPEVKNVIQLACIKADCIPVGGVNRY